MQMGNTDVDFELVLDLQHLGFAVQIKEAHDELFINSAGVALQNDRLQRALEIMGNLRPDECSVEEGRLRLWWD